MNSPLLIIAIHCFDHSRVILFTVSRISVILLVSLPPQSKALSPFSNPLWTYAALHVSPLTKPLIAMRTFYCHWIKSESKPPTKGNIISLCKSNKGCEHNEQSAV